MGISAHFSPTNRRSVWRLRRDLNPRPLPWQGSALTNWATEPNKWWTFTDLNRGPIGYEPTALTNWAKGPLGRGEETRTPGPMVPNHVRYQLRHTPTRPNLLTYLSYYNLQHLSTTFLFFSIIFLFFQISNFCLD